jgi:hypothetical protein
VCRAKVLEQHPHRRRKASHITPPELILVPDGCTLAQLKTAVTEAFKTLYRLAAHWACDAVQGLPEAALGPPKPAAAAVAAATAAAAGNGNGCGGAAAAAAAAAEDSRRVLGLAVPRGAVLTATGRGLDTEARWVVWCAACLSAAIWLVMGCEAQGCEAWFWGVCLCMFVGEGGWPRCCGAHQGRNQGRGW